MLKNALQAGGRANAEASYYSNDAAGEVVKPAGHL